MHPPVRLKNTVRSNCNPDLLSASFGPSSDYVHPRARKHVRLCLRICIRAGTHSYVRTRTHVSTMRAYTHCSTARTPLWSTLRFLPPFPRRANSAVLEPFPPTSLLRSVLTLSSRTERPHSPGDKASSYSFLPVFSLRVETERSQCERARLFVDFRPPSPTSGSPRPS